MEISVHVKTYARIFIAALFVITQNWKQPKCPTGGEWLHKLVHTLYTHYGIILRIKKKPIVDACNNLDASQGHYAERKKKMPQKGLYCMSVRVTF